MKTKLIPLASLAGILIFALPSGLRAGDTTAPATTPPVATTPGTTIGKNHQDINAWLNDHPKLKAKVLAKFDANHNGILDGDEITAFLKWRKERRAKKLEAGGNKGGQTTTTPPAITSPTVQ